MSNEAKVQQLLKHFGGNLDREVLESVLEIAAGNVSDAIKFLEIQAGDQQQQQVYNNYVKVQQQNTGGAGTSQNVLPPEYMTKPPNWMDPSAIKSRTVQIDERTKRANEFKKLFLEECTLVDHFTILADTEKSVYYTAVLLLMLHQGMELSHNTKSRVLAGFWAKKQNDIAEYILTKYDKQFGLIEVLKALKILDTPRRINAVEKKIAKIKNTAKPKTINKLRAQINDLKQDLVPDSLMKTSVSGALTKRIKKWVSRIPKEQLAFFALHLPKEPWKELADICHFNPKDFQLEWFLTFEFGANPPTESVIVACTNLDPSNILEIVQKYHVPYSYLRKQVPQLSPEVKLAVAKYETIDTVIWWYEELSDACPQVAEIVSERLDKGERPSFGYGKLMERCLYFKQINASFYNKIIPIAEARLKQIQLPLEPVVVVCGDSSYSMDVAIRTSTIISSVVVALTVEPELKFFNNKSNDAPYLPKTASQVLDLATTTKADGLTAPACVLMPYYKNKKPIRFFIMVTDEIENEKSNGYYFAQLFYRYYSEVYPANLVMISFLENPNSQEKGRMVKALESFGITPMQFVLDQTRPDLTKLDKILASLSTETNFFGVQVEQVHQAYKQKQSLDTVLTELNALKQPEVLKKPAPSASSSATPAEHTEKTNIVNPEDDKEKKTAPMNVDEEGTPHEFLCPITHELMKDPVTAADGYTYEKTSILTWFEKNDTSPITGEKVEVKMVFPNFPLRSRIKEFMENNK